MESVKPVAPVTIYPLIIKNNPELKKYYDQQALDALQRARAYLVKNGLSPVDARAYNLIQLAEIAYRNGNAMAVVDYSNRAILMLEPENIVKNKNTVRPVEKQPQKIHENAIRKNIENVNKPHRETLHMYKDVSDEAGVSFTYASPLSGPESFVAVPAHEMEHVGNAVDRAIFKGDNVMVFVSYRIDYDPYTGEPFMAGGTTRTITVSHHYRRHSSVGSNIDMVA